MSEAEKQEGQKTVVAFITGLLIGGLLVWVFSSSPATAPTETTEGDTTAGDVSASETNSNAAVTGTTDVKGSDSTMATPEPANVGAVVVSNQKAGDTVAINVTAYPAKNGWVVVRDYANGAAGKILGAARFSLEEGLLPTSVGLLRNTVKGSEYQVSFYSQDDKKEFSTTGDKPLSGGEVNFKAE
jgi:cytoskeletal protein RodZ